MIQYFVDGEPTDEMLQMQAEAMLRLTPTSEGRWPRTTAGIIALAIAVYEAAWDSALSAKERREK